MQFDRSSVPQNVKKWVVLGGGGGKSSTKPINKQYMKAEIGTLQDKTKSAADFFFSFLFWLRVSLVPRK